MKGASKHVTVATASTVASCAGHPATALLKPLKGLKEKDKEPLVALRQGWQ